jgi:hypothetical protein
MGLKFQPTKNISFVTYFAARVTTMKPQQSVISRVKWKARHCYVMFTGSMHNLKYVTSQGPSTIRIPSITTIPVARNPSAVHGPTECRQCLLHLYFLSHKTCHRKNESFVSSEVQLVRLEQNCQQYPAEQDSDRNWPWPGWSCGILWRPN